MCSNTMPEEICDAHIHLFPERLMDSIIEWFLKLGWNMPYYQQSTDSLLKYLESIGVRSAFVLGYVHKKGMASKINSWIKEVSDNYSWLHPFAAIHQDDDIEEVLTQALDEWDFPGVKIHSFVQGVPVSDKRFWPVYEMLNERNKRLILHTSAMPLDGPSTKVGYVEEVVKSFPNLKITISHMGLLGEFSAALKLVESYPNIYLDTAYILGNERFPFQSEWLEGIESYPDRFIFGSDFPIMDYSPAKAIETVRQLPLSAKIKHKLLWENAMNFLK